MPSITAAPIAAETTGPICAAREANAALLGLAYLGGPYAVADRLKQMGIRGKRRSAMFCPVAQVVYKAVHKACRGEYEVTIGSHSSQVRPAGAFGYMFGVDTPAVVGEFIRLFDAGQFPDLETREPWEGLR